MDHKRKDSDLFLQFLSLVSTQPKLYSGNLIMGSLKFQAILHRLCGGAYSPTSITVLRNHIKKIMAFIRIIHGLWLLPSIYNSFMIAIFRYSFEFQGLWKGLFFSFNNCSLNRTMCIYNCKIIRIMGLEKFAKMIAILNLIGPIILITLTLLPVRIKFLKWAKP